MCSQPSDPKSFVVDPPSTRKALPPFAVTTHLQNVPEFPSRYATLLCVQESNPQAPNRLVSWGEWG